MDVYSLVTNSLDGLSTFSSGLGEKYVHLNKYSLDFDTVAIDVAKLGERLFI